MSSSPHICKCDVTCSFTTLFPSPLDSILIHLFLGKVQPYFANTLCANSVHKVLTNNCKEQLSRVNVNKHEIHLSICQPSILGSKYRQWYLRSVPPNSISSCILVIYSHIRAVTFTNNLLNRSENHLAMYETYHSSTSTMLKSFRMHLALIAVYDLFSDPSNSGEIHATAYFIMHRCHRQ